MPGAGSANNLALPCIGGHANPQPAEYEKQHSPRNTCEGCVGEHDTAICNQLPIGCVKESIIWVDTRTPQQCYVAALEQDIG